MNTASSVNEEWINKTFSPNFQSIMKQKAAESLINYITYIVGWRGVTQLVGLVPKYAKLRKALLLWLGQAI